MASPNPQDQWAELCDEFRAAQDRTLEAMRRAFSGGKMMSAEAAEGINRARAAEEKIKKRMDEFMEGQFPGSRRRGK